jgi:sugar lactone lactonase YvrE
MDQPVCILEIGNELGECPLWSPEEKALYWIDILKGRIFRLDPRTGSHESIELHQLVSSIGLCKRKKLIVGLQKSVSILDLETRQLQTVSNLTFDGSINRLNDGKCDRQGHFWCTSMNQKQIEKDTASLYKVSSSGQVTEMETHVILGNGMAWSPDNQTFYFTQTRRFAIFAYDYDAKTATISKKGVCSARSIAYRRTGWSDSRCRRMRLERPVWIGTRHSFQS